MTLLQILECQASNDNRQHPRRVGPETSLLSRTVLLALLCSGAADADVLQLVLIHQTRCHSGG